MSERRKLHLFLGAPPSPAPAPGPGAGPQEAERPPAGWRHLELTWRHGHLRPAAGDAFRAPDSDQGGPDPQTTSAPRAQDHGSNLSPDAGGTVRTPQGREEPAPRSEDQEDLQRPAESPDPDPDPGQEVHCSASLLEYLDSCFPAAQPGPGPEPGPEPEPGPGPGPGPGSGPETGLGLGSGPHCSKRPSPAVVPPLSSQTHYLSTWTLSQALVLRGRCGVQSAASPEKAPPPQASPGHAHTPPSVSSSTPELFSPVTPSLSPAHSVELFSPRPSPRAELGGVVVQATADGVLCSQEAERRDQPAKSPDLKRARVSEDVAVPAALRGLTTLLSRCNRPGARYGVLVAAVHPCHLKEVTVRSGPAAGTSVPLASVVVTDQSAVEMKVVLWRRAAFWALTVSPGDVLLITGLQVNEDRWRGETVLQSSFSSKLLNLGQAAAAAARPLPAAPHRVDAGALRSLCGYLRERRPLLVSPSLQPPQDLTRLPYAALRTLRVNTLVNALLRVTHCCSSTAWRAAASSGCRSAVQLQAVLTVEQPDGHQVALLLWGTAVDWLPRFSRDRGAVWDFQVLLVREAVGCELLELHSTPWSSVRPLDAASRRAQDFLPRRPAGSGVLELDLDTLLSQRYSGDVELRVQVSAFRFQSPPPQPVLDGSAPLDAIVAALSDDITYTGCGRCCAELATDANGIYAPCPPCLPRTAARRYYRPAVLTLRGRGLSQVCVQVPPVPLQNFLLAPPDKLQRSVAPGSQVKHVHQAARRLQSLLSVPSETVLTVRSHFLCDENSVPINQDLTLLDMQVPTEPGDTA